LKIINDSDETDDEKPVIEKPVIKKPNIKKPNIKKPNIKKPNIKKPVIKKQVPTKPKLSIIKTVTSDSNSNDIANKELQELLDHADKLEMDYDD